MTKTRLRTALALALTFGVAGWAPVTALAQVAGATTTLGVTVTESTQIALGWSVRKTLLGKPVYNEAGQRVGKIEDLIVAPDRTVSYVILGAGGFIGIGRHDVAIPVSQIKDHAGHLVMPGATKEAVKALPAFDYASDTSQRDRFVARAEQDIASGQAKVAALQKSAGSAAADAKAALDKQIAALQADVLTAEARLGEMKHAAAARWKEFEAGVSTATARLRKSLETSKA
jgi:hypothetical protein